MDHFEKIAKALDVGPVTKPAHPTRPQRMNANAFCIRNKVFAIRAGEDLVLKLPPKRVAEVIEVGTAQPYVVGDQPMKEWAKVPLKSQSKWLGLARESLAYVSGKC